MPSASRKLLGPSPRPTQRGGPAELLPGERDGKGHVHTHVCLRGTSTLPLLLFLPEVGALGQQPQSQRGTHMPGGQGRPPRSPLSDLVARSLPWTSPALGLLCHRHTLYLG